MSGRKLIAATLLFGAVCLCAGCGTEEIEEEPLPPVTEIALLEQWENAFGEERLKNFTLQSEWRITDNVTAAESYKEIEFRQDANSGMIERIERQKQSKEGETVSETRELYVKLDDQYALYRFENGSWKRESIEGEVYESNIVNSAVTLFSILGLEDMDISQEMDAFTYESTRGEYTYHNLIPGTGSLVIRFENYNLTSMTIKGGLWDEDAYYAEVEVTLSDYGTTALSVPQV